MGTDGGTRALVGGAASRTGRAVTAGLVAAGARVCMADVPGAAVRAAARDLALDGGLVSPCEADLGSAAGAAAALEEASAALAGLDLVVAACASPRSRPLGRLDEGCWAPSVQDPLRAAFTLLKAAAKVLSGPEGRIVLVAPSSGLHTSDFGHVHSATLAAAIAGLARSASAELRHRGVTVNAVLWSETAGGAALAGAVAAVGFLASSGARELTGQVVVVEDRRIALQILGQTGGASAGGGWTEAELTRRWPEIVR